MPIAVTANDLLSLERLNLRRNQISVRSRRAIADLYRVKNRSLQVLFDRYVVQFDIAKPHDVVESSCGFLTITSDGRVEAAQQSGLDHAALVQLDHVKSSVRVIGTSEVWFFGGNVLSYVTTACCCPQGSACYLEFQILEDVYNLLVGFCIKEWIPGSFAGLWWADDKPSNWKKGDVIGLSCDLRRDATVVPKNHYTYIGTHNAQQVDQHGVGNNAIQGIEYGKISMVSRKNKVEALDGHIQEVQVWSPASSPVYGLMPIFSCGWGSIRVKLFKDFDLKDRTSYSNHAPMANFASPYPSVEAIGITYLPQYPQSLPSTSPSQQPTLSPTSSLQHTYSPQTLTTYSLQHTYSPQTP